MNFGVSNSFKVTYSWINCTMLFLVSEPRKGKANPLEVTCRNSFRLIGEALQVLYQLIRWKENLALGVTYELEEWL